jgi:hypothetical protein
MSSLKLQNALDSGRGTLDRLCDFTPLIFVDIRMESPSYIANTCSCWCKYEQDKAHEGQGKRFCKLLCTSSVPTRDVTISWRKFDATSTEDSMFLMTRRWRVRHEELREAKACANDTRLL